MEGKDETGSVGCVIRMSLTSPKDSPTSRSETNEASSETLDKEQGEEDTITSEKGRKRRKVVYDSKPKKKSPNNKNIGASYQVEISPFLPFESKCKEENPSTLCWIPGRISDENLEKFFIEATKILRDYMQKNNLNFIPVPASDIFLNDCGDEIKTSTSTHKYDLLRECNQDLLLETLHSCDYNSYKALARVQISPVSYLFLLKKEEQRLYNYAYRTYSGALRMIYKHIGNRCYKELVDYFYRFKIPDQFRKFQEKKREQTRDILKTVPATETKEGAILERRLMARSFFSQVQEYLGNEAFVRFGIILESLHTSINNPGEKSDSVSKLKEEVSNMLQGPSYDVLYAKFLEFLPKKLRN